MQRHIKLFIIMALVLYTSTEILAEKGRSLYRTHRSEQIFLAYLCRVLCGAGACTHKDEWMLGRYRIKQSFVGYWMLTQSMWKWH